jgi:guanyl-specific ribonuclease Sa
MRGLFWLWAGLALGFTAAAGPAPAQEKPEVKLPKGVPEKVAKVLQYVDEHGKPMPGYEGGRNFGNFEKRLPQFDKKNRKIRYREWDVNPLRKGINRGAERLVTGSDGSAHYTKDHYKTFIKIR